MPQQASTIIKDGIVILGYSVSQQDLFITGESIAAVGNLSGLKADQVIDASGLLVMPGAIDTHVHFNDEFMGTVSVHDYYSGTRAAAFGGVTSVIDFSNQAPGGSLMSTITNKLDEAEGKALIDWGVHPVITQPTEDTLDEILLVVSRGAPTIKCYMTYRSEGLLIEKEDLLRISERLDYAGGMLMVHAEDNDTVEENIPRLIEQGKVQPIYHAESRPAHAEDLAIQQAIEVARESGGRVFVVHLASAQGMELIAAARARGIDIYAETCTHYLIFTEDMLRREDGMKWVCSPPLRDQAIQDTLWMGIHDGRISMVTSDDAAYSWDAKLFGKERFDKCPNGIAGIESRLSLLYSEGVTRDRLSLPRFVELVSSAPARLFGLSPKKGNLFPGADADIVLFDPFERWTMNSDTLHMATDYAAYDNIEVTGRIKKVFSRGELIIDGSECLVEKGRGQYLHRKLDKSVFV
ncbi:dihydropyrimidinase [candidate division KSB1 bacterium]